MNPKLRSHASKPGVKFRVVKTFVYSMADRYRVYMEGPGDSSSLLAMFRYKYHAEHFKDYMEMRFK